MKTVCLVNQSTKLKSEYVTQLALGMTKFVQEDVCPAWGLEPWQVIADHVPGKADMFIYLVDEFADKTLTGILGYHAVSSTNQPVGFVNVALCYSIFGDTHINPIGSPTEPYYFPGTDIISPFSVSEVISHELAEMLINPIVNRFAQSTDKKFWSMEIADPSDNFRYAKRIDWKTQLVNRLVNHYRYMTFQDFVYPAFYESQSVGPYSHTGGVKKPFNLDGGYENIIGAKLAPIDFIQAKNFSPGRGNRKIRLIAWHTMEARETTGKALQVARWFQGKTPPKASAHYMVDNKKIIQTVREKDTAWSLGNFYYNQISINFELAGYASQSIGQWSDQYSIAELELAAKLAADIGRRYNIPPVHLTIPQILAGHSGHVGHADITKAAKIYGGHTDPGKYFPWNSLMKKVSILQNPVILK